MPLATPDTRSSRVRWKCQACPPTNARASVSTLHRETPMACWTWGGGKAERAGRPLGHGGGPADCQAGRDRAVLRGPRLPAVRGAARGGRSGGGGAAHTRTVGTGVSFDTSTKNPETGRTQSVGLVLTKSVRQGHSVDQALARQKSRS